MPCTESAWKWPANRVLARRRALWRACADGESKRPGLSMKSMRCPASRKADSVPERGLLAISGLIPRTTCWVVRSAMPHDASNRMAGRIARHDAPRDATSRAASRAPCGFVASRPASLCDAARPALRGSVALRAPHPATALRAPRSADLSRHVPSRRASLPAPRGSVAHLSLRGSVTSRAAPRRCAVRDARSRCARAIYRAVFTVPFSQRLPQESMMAPSR